MTKKKNECIIDEYDGGGQGDVGVIREGEPVQEIMKQVNEDPEIGVLVLGAGTDKRGPGPLVTQLSKNSGSLPIPLTVVPGDMSKDRLEAIT